MMVWRLTTGAFLFVCAVLAAACLTIAPAAVVSVLLGGSTAMLVTLWVVMSVAVAGGLYVYYAREDGLTFTDWRRALLRRD